MSKAALISLAVFMFLITDVIAASWAKSENKYLLMIMILISPFGYLSFAFLNQKMGLGASSAIINTLIVIGGVIMGRLFFSETLSIQQYMGIFFGVFAIYLISSH